MEVNIIDGETRVPDETIDLPQATDNLYYIMLYRVFLIFQSDWLIRLEKILVKLDNLCWYCDVTNVFIRQRQIQIVT
jgi:uncharacterized membrane protein